MKNRSNDPQARAILKGGSAAPELRGEALFFPKRTGVLVVVRVCGLPEENADGFFALHIHEGDSCAEDFSETGGHYNPDSIPHPRHAGDLPPLLSCGGKAYLAVWTDRFSVSQILGRTVIIHDGPDDFTSQPAGNAGTKIACGIIRKAENKPF